MHIFVDFWNALVDLFAQKLGWQGMLLAIGIGVALTLCMLSAPH